MTHATAACAANTHATTPAPRRHRAGPNAICARDHVSVIDLPDQVRLLPKIRMHQVTSAWGRLTAAIPAVPPRVRSLIVLFVTVVAVLFTFVSDGRGGRVRACVRACVHANKRARVRACVHACVRACMFACVSACVRSLSAHAASSSAAAATAAAARRSRSCAPCMRATT